MLNILQLWGIVNLEAWYKGNDHYGCVYLFTAIALDAAGNEATSQATVTIIHDRANGMKC